MTEPNARAYRVKNTSTLYIKYFGSGIFLKWSHLFLCPWHFVCQFSTISNKIELRGKLSNKNYHFLLQLKRKDTFPVLKFKDVPYLKFRGHVGNKSLIS